MRIHTSATNEQVTSAAIAAGVTMTKFATHASRSHLRAFEVKLSGSSNRGQNSDPPPPAATWDEWGNFLAGIFATDESAKIGPYRNAEHFHWTTGGRFPVVAGSQHRQHRWNYQGQVVTGAYAVHECSCGAIQRNGDWDRVSAA